MIEHWVCLVIWLLVKVSLDSTFMNFGKLSIKRIITVNIVDAATKMYEKFCNFAESFEKIGIQIQTAQDSYVKAKGQLNEGKNNLIKQIDSLQNLGISTKKQIPENIKC